MRILRTYFFFTLIFISLSGCDFSDYKLKVWNNTKDSIAFIIPTQDNFPTLDSENTLSKKENDSLLKTVVFYDAKDDDPFGGVHFLAANSDKKFMVFNTTWEGVIERYPKKKLVIYFFPVSVMTSGNYTWKDIWNKKLYKKKIELDESELKKLDWNVHYKVTHRPTASCLAI